MRVRLAGGAQILDDSAQLAVGKRNYMAARKLLWQMGVIVEMAPTGALFEEPSHPYTRLLLSHLQEGRP